jgi:transcriptional regulator with XRE-family HTH domain
MAKVWAEADAAQFEASITSLKRYRQDRGLTQEQIAGQLQVSTRTVARWEHGVYRGDRRNADAVGAFLRARIQPPGQIEADIMFTGISVDGERCAEFVVFKVTTEAELRDAAMQHLRVLAHTGFIRHEGNGYRIVSGSAFVEIVCDLTDALAALAAAKAEPAPTAKILR